MAILNEQANEARDKVFRMAASEPDKLTGRTAIRLAARAQSLWDFKDELEDELKILAPNPQGRGK